MAFPTRQYRVTLSSFDKRELILQLQIELPQKVIASSASVCFLQNYKITGRSTILVNNSKKIVVHLSGVVCPTIAQLTRRRPLMTDFCSFTKQKEKPARAFKFKKKHDTTKPHAQKRTTTTLLFFVRQKNNNSSH